MTCFSFCSLFFCCKKCMNPLKILFLPPLVSIVWSNAPIQYITHFTKNNPIRLLSLKNDFYCKTFQFIVFAFASQRADVLLRIDIFFLNSRFCFCQCARWRIVFPFIVSPCIPCSSRSFVAHFGTGIH